MSTISNQDPVNRINCASSSENAALEPILFEDTSSIELSSTNQTKKNILSLGLIPLVKIFVDKIALPNILRAVNNSKKEEDRRLAYRKAYFIGTKEKFSQGGKPQSIALKRNAEASIVKLTTPDKAVLDGAVIWRNGREDYSGKWIIRMMGNSGYFESSLKDNEILGRNVDANVLVFNYRGVGESTGAMKRTEDLVTDGQTAVNFLQDRGVSSEDILIIGHSLGGGVATQVASRNVEISLIVSRTFGRLTHTVRDLIPVAGRPIASLLRFYNLELNSTEKWQTFLKERADRVALIIHNEDQLIGRTSSLWKSLFPKDSKNQIGISKAHFKEKNVVQLETLVDSHGKVFKKIDKNFYALDIKKFFDEIQNNFMNLENRLRAWLPKDHVENFDFNSNDIEDFKNNIKEKISLLKKAKLNKQLSNEELKDIREWIKNLNKLLKDLRKIQGKPADLKFVDPHDYRFDYDDESYEKIVTLCKNILGT